MSKIHQAFQPGRKALIIFLTAGDPNLEKTKEYILGAEKAGADLIEIGIPFSDPVAEGPVIQKANERALSHGTKIRDIFTMVAEVRQVTQVPLVFLTYINPIVHYGKEKFIQSCVATGIDGLVIPDLPFEEREELGPLCEKNNIDLISLIAPTSQDRITKIASQAKGFVYCVSSMGVTGIRSQFSAGLPSLTAAIKENTQTPVAIGFGISTPEQVTQLKNYADGLIVGSAVVKIIGEHGADAAEPLANYIHSLRTAMDT